MTEVRQGTPEKVDAGHFVSTLGGAVMSVVVALCVVGLAAPWWTLEENTDVKLLIEVSLWTRYARSESVSDAATLDCDTMCDMNNVGSSMIREIKDKWSTYCRDATDELASTCSQLWVLRVCLLVAWGFSLLYTATSMLNYCGAGKPAACRCPPGIAILLAIGCLPALAIALVAAGSLAIEVEPPTPGSEVRVTAVPMKSIDMNGIGFKCILVAIFVSVLGLLLACMNEKVVENLQKHLEFENGRPIADEVDHIPHHHTVEKPPSTKLNNWTTQIEDYA
jgi:hypothetical protein